MNVDGIWLHRDEHLLPSGQQAEDTKMQGEKRNMSEVACEERRRRMLLKVIAAFIQSVYGTCREVYRTEQAEGGAFWPPNVSYESRAQDKLEDCDQRATPIAIAELYLK